MAAPLPKSRPIAGKLLAMQGVYLSFVPETRAITWVQLPDSIISDMANFSNFEAQVLSRLNLIIANQTAAAAQEKIYMTALDTELAAMTADIAAQTTEVASMATFIQGLFAKIAAIPGLTPEQQASLDAIKAGLESNTAAIAAAIVVPAASA